MRLAREPHGGRPRGYARARGPASGHDAGGSLSTRHDNPFGGAPSDPLVLALQRAYADALLQGDETVAERVMGEALDAGLEETRIADAIIAPAMRVVGDLWESGAISVADEHFATHVTTRMLALLREAFRTARERSRHRVLLAAMEGEHHVIGLEMVANVLGNAGYDVRMLGADVPVDDLAGAIRRHRPVVVGLSATMPASASLVPAAIQYVRREAPMLGILVGGGSAFERLAATPGVSRCEHVSDAVDLVDALVKRASMN